MKMGPLAGVSYLNSFSLSIRQVKRAPQRGWRVKTQLRHQLLARATPSETQSSTYHWHVCRLYQCLCQNWCVALVQPSNAVPPVISSFAIPGDEQRMMQSETLTHHFTKRVLISFVFTGTRETHQPSRVGIIIRAVLLMMDWAHSWRQLYLIQDNRWGGRL